MAAVLVLVLLKRGADLGSPADPSEQYAAARPEWYFLFLFEFLKYFPGRSEIFGALVIPGLVMLVLFLMPLIGRDSLGHRLNLVFTFALLGGAALLTVVAVAKDRANPDYVRAVEVAERQAHRVLELAQSSNGIPRTGAVYLLREDPYTRGPHLFAQHCASCHRYDGHDGQGRQVAEAQAASDLKGFASRAWLAGMLDPEQVGSPHYLGATAFKNGKMVKFVRRKLGEADAETKAAFAQAVISLSAEAQLPRQKEADAREAEQIKLGRAAITGTAGCADCHQFHTEDEDASGPDLTGYGSRDWLLAFLNDPSHKKFYGERNDRMPSFGKNAILSPQEIGLLADWLREDWYEPSVVQGDRRE
jgi:ubiquinol-cytochrome c reductase cytochrome b subunit